MGLDIFIFCDIFNFIFLISIYEKKFINDQKLNFITVIHEKEPHPDKKIR